jgi:hypothetical protein
METITLGSELAGSHLGFGCAAISDFSEPRHDTESIGTFARRRPGTTSVIEAESAPKER